jgi:hypothetical protein
MWSAKRLTTPWPAGPVQRQGGLVARRGGHRAPSQRGGTMTGGRRADLVARRRWHEQEGAMGSVLGNLSVAETH